VSDRQLGVVRIHRDGTRDDYLASAIEIEKSAKAGKRTKTPAKGSLPVSVSRIADSA
jgi:hypothetical protein